MKKIKSLIKLIKEFGFSGLISILTSKYGLPTSNKAKHIWRSALISEIQFWDNYYRTKGLEWSDQYHLRFDPELPLQPRPTALLPEREKVKILDVGAGPQTYLGKKVEGKTIELQAVDPLADAYDKIFKKYNITPLVRTKKLASEDLKKRYSPNEFDLVFARNCIDHAYEPENAIMHMVDIVKNGCYVLLEHRPDEAETENYVGLHQWNFSMNDNGDFIIRSKDSEVNMSEKYAQICEIKCETLQEPEDGEWLITRILKK